MLIECMWVFFSAFAGSMASFGILGLWNRKSDH